MLYGVQETSHRLEPEVLDRLATGTSGLLDEQRSGPQRTPFGTSVGFFAQQRRTDPDQGSIAVHSRRIPQNSHESASLRLGEQNTCQSDLSCELSQMIEHELTCHHYRWIGPRLTTEEGRTMESGKVFAGRYEITGGPRSGGMGSVYRALDTTTGRAVAVKFLARTAWDGPAGHGGVRPGANDFKRFERERTMHERLGGEGVPRLVDYDFACGRPYLVTEFIEGKNLRDFLVTHRPTLTATVAVVVQVLRILTRVHSAGVIHRDVKPHNIVLADDGTAHLVDFGIALPTDPDATRHTEGRTPGSIGYKAPEIILGERNPGPAADVYGIGCTLFRLVTGEHVFVMSSPDHMIEWHHCETPAPRLDALVDGLPTSLVDLAAHMLDKDPAARPTAAEAESALQPFLPQPGAPAPHPVLVPDPTAPFRAGITTTTGAVDTLRHKAAATGRRRPVVHRPPSARPTRAGLRSLIARTTAELTEHGPGPYTQRLVRHLPDARSHWGGRDPDVLRALLLRADAARLSGDWPGAGAGYRAVAREMAGAAVGTAEHVLALEARIGAAECTVPEEHDARSALLSWERVVLEACALLPDVPDRLVRRCREVGQELAECGHTAVVETLLERLPGN
ncbi:protein kinase [Streptomyces sp. H28]|uniref:serine/threonine protein kinase n=2 Tax=Streptomyces sp. H28 TaxID=2775865 RepID=UPI0017811CC3|nr:serine/threonine-protein kinase [Streptomyces sp. H28]MBD9730707.1 protein kinase [Streptomyces sp. H28]